MAQLVLSQPRGHGGADVALLQELGAALTGGDEAADEPQPAQWPLKVALLASLGLLVVPRCWLGGPRLWADWLFVVSFAAVGTALCRLSLLFGITYYSRPAGVTRGIVALHLHRCLESYGWQLGILAPSVCGFALLGGCLGVVVQLGPPDVESLRLSLGVWCWVAVVQLLAVSALFLGGLLKVPHFARDAAHRLPSWLLVVVLVAALAAAWQRGGDGEAGFAVLLASIALPICVGVAMPTMLFLLQLVRPIFAARGKDFFTGKSTSMVERVLNALSVVMALTVPFTMAKQAASWFIPEEEEAEQSKVVDMLEKSLPVVAAGLKPALLAINSLGPRLMTLVNPEQFFELQLNLNYYDLLANMQLEEFNRRSQDGRKAVPLDLHTSREMLSLLALFASMIYFTVLAWASAAPLQGAVGLDLLGFSHLEDATSYLEVPFYFLLLGSVLWHSGGVRELWDIAGLSLHMGYRVQWELQLLELLFESPSDYEEAARRLQDALAEHPENHRLAFWRGALYAFVDDYSAAKPLLERAVEGRESFPDAWYELGVGRLQADGDAEAAVQAMRRALSYKPRSSTFLSNLGHCLQLLPEPKHEEAIVYLRKSLAMLDSKDQRRVMIYSWLAGSYEDLGRDTEAEAALSSALEVQPRDAIVRIHLARLLLKRGERHQALEEGRKVLRDDTWDEILVAALSGVESSMRRRRRIAVFEEVAGLLGHIGGEALQDAATAKAKFFEEAEAYTADHPVRAPGATVADGQMAWLLANALVKWQRGPGDHQQCLRHCQDIIAVQLLPPSSMLDARKVAAQLLQNFGDQEGALAEAEQALASFAALGPGDRAKVDGEKFEAICHNVAGKSCGVLGKKEEAIQHFQALTTLQPDNSTAWRFLGIAQGQLGQLEAADATYMKACQVQGVYTGAGSAGSADAIALLVAEWIITCPGALQRLRADHSLFGGGGAVGRAWSLLTLAIALRIAELPDAEAVGAEMLQAAAGEAEAQRLEMADACSASGYTDLSKQLLEATPGPGAECRKASIMLGDQETAQAEALLQAAAQRYPGSAEVARLLATVLLESQRAEEAIAVVDKALGAAASDGTGHESPPLLFLKAKALTQVSRYPEAEATLRRLETAATAAGDDVLLTKARELLELFRDQGEEQQDGG